MIENHFAGGSQILRRPTRPNDHHADRTGLQGFGQGGKVGDGRQNTRVGGHGEVFNHLRN